MHAVSIVVVWTNEIEVSNLRLAIVLFNNQLQDTDSRYKRGIEGTR